MAFLAVAVGGLGIILSAYELCRLNDYFDEVYGR